MIVEDNSFKGIQAKSPFSEYKLYGPIFHKKEIRRFVVLYKSHQNRTTLAYAKYLMCVKVGRILSKDEVVDHIDNNSLNDVIENLQIITQTENKNKSVRGYMFYIYECPNCKTIFERRFVSGDYFTACSRECSGILGNKVFSKKIDPPFNKPLTNYRKIIHR